MNRQRLASYGIGIKRETYFIVLIIYYAGDERYGLVRQAVFSVN